MLKKTFTLLLVLSLSGCATAKDKPADDAKPITRVPHCDAPLGTAALIEDAIPGLDKSGLPSPAPLLRLMLANSNCFQVVDRGPAMARIEKERALAAGGALKDANGFGGGQILAADYLITPNVVFSDKDSGGVLGVGALSNLIGGFSLKKLRANTVLSMTDTRTGAQLAIAQGLARKNDLALAGGVLDPALGGGGLGLYESTDLGKIVALAFVDAYARLVQQAQKLPKPQPVAEPVEMKPVEATPIPAAKSAERGKPEAGAYRTAISISLRNAPGWDSAEITRLPAGTEVVPTGGAEADWWLVNANGQVGWMFAQALKLVDPAEPAQAAPGVKTGDSGAMGNPEGGAAPGDARGSLPALQSPPDAGGPASH